jgi:hypothetical protein
LVAYGVASVQVAGNASGVNPAAALIHHPAERLDLLPLFFDTFFDSLAQLLRAELVGIALNFVERGFCIG